jgi:two-component system, response regulator PdtaR
VRILIAEDETIIRLDLRDLLERAGHEVVAEARDGEEAVALAREHSPELAVLDVKMPRLDGIEAARRILADQAIPIVMLTAYGQDELVGRAVEAGVFGYLVKPFRAKGLLMEKEGLTEDVAFSRLRGASQATGRPLRVIAEAVIATFEAR